MIEGILSTLRRTPRWVWALLALGHAILIFTLSSTTLPKAPGKAWMANLGHAPMFGLLAVWVVLALGEIQRDLREKASCLRSLVAAWLMTVAYGVSDEYHQSWTPGRNPDPIDLVIDALGALWALLLLHALLRGTPRGAPLIVLSSALFVVTLGAALVAS